MSSAATEPKPLAGYESSRPATRPVVRRSFLRQVIYDTFGQRTARFGLFWIGLLVVLGVLAPFIASSHPIVMRVNGEWSSPMWRHLTPVDLILTGGLIAFLVSACARRFNTSPAFADAGAFAAMITPAVLLNSGLRSVEISVLVYLVPVLLLCVASVALVVGAFVSLIAGWRNARAVISAVRLILSALGVVLIAVLRKTPFASVLSDPDAPTGMVILAALFASTAIAICYVIWNLKNRRLLFAVAVPAALATIVLLLIPPKIASTVDFQRYRDLERRAAVDPNFDVWMIRTLIPYSPTDRVRDMPWQRLTPPAIATGRVTTSDDRSTAGAIRKLPIGDVVVTESQRPTTVPAAAIKSVAIDPFGSRHWLGTETDGADLLSRMIHAARIALAVGLISTGIALTIGMLVGGLMGYYVGWVDLIGMRLVEIFEATPRLLVLIIVMAAYGRNLYLMMAVIGVLGWTGTARFVRGEFLKLRKQDFVQAGIAVGLPMSTVIYRHILPNALTPVLVTATFSVAGAIETEAILSFLGLGLIDEPSWGQMLQQARSGGQGFVWWMAIFPGLAIFLTIFAYALIGDAMRDALDPKLRKRE